jgi:hypothetical protein
VISLFWRGTIGLVAGALAGFAALTLSYFQHPGVTMEMDRGAGSVVAGLYDVERVGQETYAWTRREVTLQLPGLDRRVAWACTVRLRGARSDVSTLPQVVLAVDGVIAATHQSSNDYQDITVPLPPRPQLAGATVTLTSSDTVVPGPSDRRALGVMVDRWSCAPAPGAFVWPPPRILRAAALGGAVFGLAFALIGAGTLATLAGAGLLAAAQAVPLGWEFGMFSPYPERAAWLAVWIAGLLVASVRIAEWRLGRRLHGAARFVAIVTFAVLYLKLLALVHPSKPIIDAVFHAHRLQWVLEGRFYFTQPMPSGVRFPYAIGLYIFSAPWAMLTSDFVFLLRIIVSAAEAFGGVLLYLLISRIWGDRLAGGVAAALFHLVPRTFEIVGNANMTNAFAQSAALVVLSAATLWPLQRRDWRHVAGLTLLTAFALLSHISTFTLLGAILLVLAGLYWWKGGPELRAASLSILIALVVAAVLAVVLYYAHFGDAYRTAARVRAGAAASAPAGQNAPGVPPAAPARAASTALPSKISGAATLSVAAVGWPIFLLALIGAVRFLRGGVRDRLGLALAALGITYAVFVTGVVLMPVEQSFQRYAAEFISRVTLATYPAMVMLAALGASWAWRAGWAGRAAALIGLFAAGYVGVDLWVSWLR